MVLEPIAGFFDSNHFSLENSLILANEPIATINKIVIFVNSKAKTSIALEFGPISVYNNIWVMYVISIFKWFYINFYSKAPYPILG